MRLTHQQKRHLKRLFGHRAKFDPTERRLYARDVSNPPAPVRMMIDPMPGAVVFPQTEDELIDLLRFANSERIPLVPRGGGTAGYGGAMPVKGGIVVDMAHFAKPPVVHQGGKTATVGAGMTFLDAEAHLKRDGKALCIMPTSAPSATLGGWLCQGGAGLGSLRYGWVHDVVRSVRVVLPNGERRTFSGSELDVVSDMEGTTGFVTSVTVQIRDDTPLVPFTAAFADSKALEEGVNRLKASFPFWTMLVHDPDFNALRQEVTGERNIPKKQFSVVMAIEEDQMPSGGRAAIEEVVKAAGGQLIDDKKAASEWAMRFGLFRVKRLGPSIVPGEAVVQTAHIGRSIAAIHEAVRSAHFNLEGIVAGDETVWFGFALDDERRKEYPAGFGAAIAMLGAAKKMGGRSLGTGVYMSREARRIFAEPRIERVQHFRHAVDPNDIMNPGKVFGAPIRFKPSWAPGPNVAQALIPGNPILKMAHGSSFVRYQRREEARNPYASGLSAALGAAGAGAFGRKWSWDVVVADLDTNIRSASASARAFKDLASSPLGWVRWANEYVHRGGKITPYQFQMLHGEGVAAGAELASEMDIRYAELFQDLKTHLVEEGFRPLPAHRRIAEHIAKSHNQFGAPHEERGEWAEGLELGTKGDLLLFVDDTVSYKAPHVARNAEEILRRGGKRVAYLGPDEWSSGAVLLQTGQKAAALDVVKHNIEAITKAGIKEVVTPDAYALHAFKNDYPRIAAELGLTWNVNVYHLHEYAAKLIDDGKIPQGGAVNVQVALHHPPILTLNGVTEEMVRKVLTWIPGLQVVPLVHEGRYALDVGASGAVPDTYPEISDKAGRLVVEEARRAGVDLIVSSDPASELILKKVGERVAAEEGIQNRPALPDLGGAPVPERPDEDEAEEEGAAEESPEEASPAA